MRSTKRNLAVAAAVGLMLAVPGIAGYAPRVIHKPAHHGTGWGRRNKTRWNLPHQGKREIARRLRQIAAGTLQVSP